MMEIAVLIPHPSRLSLLISMVPKENQVLHKHEMEEESKKIGQELHDGLSQTLSAIKLWVEAAQIQMRQENAIETGKALEAVIPLVQTSIEEIRRVSRHLRPSVLDDLGLLPDVPGQSRAQ